TAPAALRRPASLLAGIGGKLLPKGSGLESKLRTFTDFLSTQPRLWSVECLMRFDSKVKQNLYSDDFASSLQAGAAELLLFGLYDDTDAEEVVDLALNLDLNLYLPYDLLVKVDIASMAYGLEARAPMLDHEFVEFAARLPTRLKIGRLSGKAI